MRLHCRAAENLMLSDDALALAGTDWPTVESRIHAWLASDQDHSRRSAIAQFRDEGFDRSGFNLKEVRMLLIGTFIDTTKPWEVLVGQAIGTIVVSASEHSLSTFLGEKVCNHLLQQP